MDHGYVNGMCKNCGLCRGEGIISGYNFYIQVVVKSGDGIFGTDWQFYRSEPKCADLIMENVLR